MTALIQDFSRKAFCARPDYDEPRVRREFARLVPLRENTAIVHHTHCGATSFTADGIADRGERQSENQEQ